MKKRILSLLLAMVMVIGSFPITVQAGSLDSGLVYEVHEDYVEITGYTGTAFNLVIPAEIESLPVTSIGAYAFQNCASLISITIPDSVTSIGEGAFDSCESLTSIKIPDGITSIGDWAFAQCDSLTSINIPDGVTSIGDYTFWNCDSLTTVEIPDSVTSIGGCAFRDCESLTSIDIPDGVTSISTYTFAYCYNLTSIDIPDSVSSIGKLAFRSCYSLTNIDIPEGVTSIDYYAFAYCHSLTRIDFNGDAPTFGDEVFSSVTAAAYYPADNTTWTDSVKQNYGGSITWVPYDPNHIHAYEATATEPTCTEQGFTTYTCSCGDSYVSDYVDALGHDMGEWKTVIAPTCTEEGSESRICSRCDYTETQSIDAVGHSYTGTVTAPTCTEQGFTTYTCSCGDTYVSDEVPALGHTEETIPAVAATCIETGLTEGKKCSVCGEVQVAQETVTALGHDWKGTSCQRCDATRENPFTDVADGSFYINPVLWAVENGVTSGTSETTFDPSGLCLRAHVVTFLYRAAGSPAPGSAKNPFTDVKSGDFYYNPVLWAVEKGVTQGVSNTQFGSAQVCNRAAVVTFLWRAFGTPEPESANNPFADVKSTDFFYKPVLWAVENGITSGVDATHFNPAGNCNRAQVVTFLYRAYN